MLIQDFREPSSQQVCPDQPLKISKNSGIGICPDSIKQTTPDINGLQKVGQGNFSLYLAIERAIKDLVPCILSSSLIYRYIRGVMARRMLGDKTDWISVGGERRGRCSDGRRREHHGRECCHVQVTGNRALEELTIALYGKRAPLILRQIRGSYRVGSHRTRWDIGFLLDKLIERAWDIMAEEWAASLPPPHIFMSHNAQSTERSHEFLGALSHDTNEKTGRSWHPLRSQKSSIRRRVLRKAGLIHEVDIRKANFSIVAVESGSPILLNILRDTERAYRTLADAAGVDASVIKAEVNQHIAAPLRSYPSVKAFHAAGIHRHGGGWRKLFSVLEHIFREIDVWVERDWNGTSTKDIGSDIACYLMRRVSRIIDRLEAWAQREGVIYFNVYDSLNTNQPIPNNVLDETLAAEGLTGLQWAHNLN